MLGMLLCALTLISDAQTPTTFSTGQLGAPAQQPGQPRPPANPGAPPPAGTSTVRGHVFAADSGQPLRKAQVRIVSGEIRENRLATTDVDGAYEFKEVRAGRYTISANKGSYVGLSFGQQRPIGRVQADRDPRQPDRREDGLRAPARQRRSRAASSTSSASRCPTCRSRVAAVSDSPGPAPARADGPAGVDERHRRVPAVRRLARSVLPRGDVARAQPDERHRRQDGVRADVLSGHGQSGAGTAHHAGCRRGKGRHRHGAPADSRHERQRHRDRVRRQADDGRGHRDVVERIRLQHGRATAPSGPTARSGSTASRLANTRCAPRRLAPRVTGKRRQRRLRRPATTSRTCSSSGAKPSSATGRIVVDPAAAAALPPGLMLFPTPIEPGSMPMGGGPTRMGDDGTFEMKAAPGRTRVNMVRRARLGSPRDTAERDRHHGRRHRVQAERRHLRPRDRDHQQARHDHRAGDQRARRGGERVFGDRVRAGSREVEDHGTLSGRSGDPIRTDGSRSSGLHAGRLLHHRSREDRSGSDGRSGLSRIDQDQSDGDHDSRGRVADGGPEDQRRSLERFQISEFRFQIDFRLAFHISDSFQI